MAFSSKYEDLVGGAGRDYKQAMKECERKLKKTPKEPSLLLFKAFIFLKQRQYEHAEEQCAQFSKLDPPITEQRFIDEIHDVYAKVTLAQGKSLLSSDKSIYALWENLLKAAGPSRKRELQEHIFSTSAALGFWETAQKALIALKKDSPNDSRIFFTHILITQLLSRIYGLRGDSMRKQLFQSMAFKTLAGAVQTTLKESNPNGLINNTQHLRFITQVYREQEKYMELLEVLDNPQIGLLSPLGKADIEFLHARLECLFALEMWEELAGASVLSVTSGVAFPGMAGRWRYDWKIWEYIALAHVKFDSEKSQPVFHSFFTEFEKVVDYSSSKSRPVWLSALTYTLRIPDNAKYERHTLFHYCLEYLRRHHFQRYCFNDLRSFVERLDEKEMRRFQNQCRKLASSCQPGQSGQDTADMWAVSELNSLKFDYLLSVVCIKHPEQSVVEAFILNTLRFCKVQQKLDGDSYVLDEACLLAASALEFLAAGADEDVQSAAPQIRTVQAFYLVHDMLYFNPRNYNARVLLIKLARTLGLVSVAMENYQELGIREIQNETLSHLLFNRISWIHPFEVSGPERRKLDGMIADPYKGLGKVLTWYDVACEKINGFLGADIDNYRYDKAVEFYNLKSGLQNSLWKQMAAIERRRIARLTDRPYDEADSIDSLLDSWIGGAVDLRDHVQTSFSASGQAHDLRGEYEGRMWVSLMSHSDIAESMLVARDPVAEWKTVQIQTRAIDAFNSGKALELLAFLSEFLGFEQATIQFWTGLAGPCVVVAKGDPEGMSESQRTTKARTVVSAFGEVEKMIQGMGLPDASEYVTLPDEYLLESLIQVLEIQKFSHKFLDAAIMQSKNKNHLLYRKVPVERAEKIKLLIKTRAEGLRRFVQGWKDYLVRNEREVFSDRIFKDKIGMELKKLIGKNSIEGHILVFRNSALDSLDGLLKIKVP
ncbi:hypothetical protein NA57DRAFT_56172 [Rhizodiscina lignyota]|uniref:Uncharacterized protein n=1 Tax=Rhizodiscina lignyota TaxID=1504668 RepID=A0A9P4IEF8_9PEZI|nr:hypothetical protein NA57DRAFT_56172 [Rhizodiscina lignyota]